MYRKRDLDRLPLLPLPVLHGRDGELHAAGLRGFTLRTRQLQVRDLQQTGQAMTLILDGNLWNEIDYTTFLRHLFTSCATWFDLQCTLIELPPIRKRKNIYLYVSPIRRNLYNK